MRAPALCLPPLLHRHLRVQSRGPPIPISARCPALHLRPETAPNGVCPSIGMRVPGVAGLSRVRSGRGVLVCVQRISHLQTNLGNGVLGKCSSHGYNTANPTQGNPSNHIICMLTNFTRDQALSLPLTPAITSPGLIRSLRLRLSLSLSQSPTHTPSPRPVTMVAFAPAPAPALPWPLLQL